MRNDSGTLVEKLGGVTILGTEEDAKAILSKGFLPTDWRNGLNLYAASQGGSATMRQVCGRGGKFKLITFNVKFCCQKGMNIAEELNSASINLANDNLNFELKSTKCAQDAKDLVALMTYNVMGAE